ncbi:MAG TPA: ATP-binding protein, partial [Rhodopila sp.]
DVVRSALETSRPLIDAAGHTLTVDLPGEPLWLDADLTRLAQVVGNLLNNAAKYTPEGGHIGLAVRAEDGAAVISVSDTGVGIPRELQARVFQLFAQVDQHLDRARGGLGIGLALVKQLVALHGGSVEVESAGIGRGSTFVVRVPLAAKGKGPDQAEEPEIVSAQATPLKVLVVDDTMEVAQTVGWMLEEMGHEYRLVHDGRKAVEAAKAFLPDAILLDIGLPGMDGYAVCRALRQEERLRSTVVIAQTGWGQDKDKASASEAGFDHHLVKPVAFQDLERLLASSVKPRQA